MLYWPAIKQVWKVVLVYKTMLREIPLIQILSRASARRHLVQLTIIKTFFEFYLKLFQIFRHVHSVRNLSLYFYYNDSFLYQPRLWPCTLSPNHRGIGMAAIPKSNESRFKYLNESAKMKKGPNYFFHNFTTFVKVM